MELGSLLRKASLLLGAPHGTLEPSFLIVHSMCVLSLPHAVQVYQLTTEIRHDLLIWTPNGFQRLFSVKKRTLCLNRKISRNLWKIGKVMFGLNKTTFLIPEKSLNISGDETKTSLPEVSWDGIIFIWLRQRATQLYM